MTWEEWESCTHPRTMLDRLLGDGGASDRKLRLFAVAGYRRFLGHMPVDDLYLEAVAVAERFADGLASLDELEAAGSMAERVLTAWRHQRNKGRKKALAVPWLEGAGRAVLLASAPPERLREGARSSLTNWVAATRAFDAAQDGDPQSATDGFDEEREVLFPGVRFIHYVSPELRENQCQLLRDVFAGPFRTWAPAASFRWMSDGDLVRRLAAAAYQERLLPSGMLDPAGLSVLSDALEEAGADEGLIGHLREPGPHARGCFVLDWLLQEG